MIYIGIDNGVTGSIGVIQNDKVHFILTPHKKELDFQSTSKKFINRIDHEKLYDILDNFSGVKTKVMLEQPMQNPRLWKASVSAIRAFENTIIALDRLNMHREYISVHSWRRELLPGYTRTMKLPQAKLVAMEMATRLFPQFKDEFEQHKDPDGIMIAEYCRRMNIELSKEPDAIAAVDLPF